MILARIPGFWRLSLARRLTALVLKVNRRRVT
jgi:hypothetical protein